MSGEKSLYHGQHVSCVVSNTPIDDAIVSIDPEEGRDSRVYLCQNTVSGANNARNKFGKKYSWFIGSIKLLEQSDYDDINKIKPKNETDEYDIF
jgi:hypothetical protein